MQQAYKLLAVVFSVLLVGEAWAGSAEAPPNRYICDCFGSKDLTRTILDYSQKTAEEQYKKEVGCEGKTDRIRGYDQWRAGCLQDFSQESIPRGEFSPLNPPLGKPGPLGTEQVGTAVPD